MSNLSNLGPYGDFTSKAKAAGGVDAFIKILTNNAVADAAPAIRQTAQRTGRLQGVLGGVAVLLTVQQVVARRAASAEQARRDRLDRAQSTAEATKALKEIAGESDAADVTDHTGSAPSIETADEADDSEGPGPDQPTTA